MHIIMRGCFRVSRQMLFDVMRIINHIETDANPTFWDCDDKWMDNRNEPVVRIGDEVFECHYEPECNCHESYIVDPRRSLCRAVYARVSEFETGAWPIADFLICLLADIGLCVSSVTRALQVAFWTMFPHGVNWHLEKSYLRICDFNAKHCDVPRVINNPFFYADPNASETRLLEIVQDSGCTYAIDLANEAASAETLAREIALLNHIHEGDATVESAYGRILLQIAGVLA